MCHWPVLGKTLSSPPPEAFGSLSPSTSSAPHGWRCLWASSPSGPSAWARRARWRQGRCRTAPVPVPVAPRGWAWPATHPRPCPHTCWAPGGSQSRSWWLPLCVCLLQSGPVQNFTFKTSLYWKGTVLFLVPSEFSLSTFWKLLYRQVKKGAVWEWGSYLLSVLICFAGVLGRLATLSNRTSCPRSLKRGIRGDA